MAKKLFSKNLLDFKPIDPSLENTELFDLLLKQKGIEVERIISTGQVTPEGQWYNQDWDEWVMLVDGEATIAFHEDEDLEDLHLVKGAYMMIPANTVHRVSYTSSEPSAVWLVLHFDRKQGR